MSEQRQIPCHVCYTNFEVSQSNEDGTNKHVPISEDSTYVWTKQIHACSVDNLICKTCIAAHLTVRLQSNQYPSCTYCAGRIEHETVMQLLPPDQRDLSEKKYWIGRGLKVCYNTNCRSNFIFEKSDDCSNPIVHCPECQYPYCAQCGDQFHGALNCNTYVEALDIMQNKVRKNGFRYCPTCKTPIERISGCNHMQCTQCAQEWCYDCELPFTPNLGHSCATENVLRVKRLENLTRLFDRLDVSNRQRGRGRGRGRGGRGRGRGTEARGGRGRGGRPRVDRDNRPANEAQAAEQPPQQPTPARGRGQARGGRGGRGRGGRARGRVPFRGGRGRDRVNRNGETMPVATATQVPQTA